MGSFYTNIAVKGPASDDVLRFLRSSQRTAYVSATHNGITVIYDEVCENQYVDDLIDLTRDLSAEFHCPALASLMHDSDDLLLLLYEDGRSVLQYESRTGPRSGASILTAAFSGFWFIPLLWIIMHLPYVVFEEFRHSWIARIIGLPPWTVSTGYKYISHDEMPPGLNPSDLQHTSDTAEE